MKDREIAALQEQLKQTNPPKRRKVAQDPNERFMLSQGNQEPSQRIRKTRNAQQQVVAVESSSESEAEPVLSRQ
ncbi:hypothetical protein DM02DRAFT_680647, partial [Periconia macrospinosa]